MADIIEVTTRQFSREFAEMKKLAKSGARVRVREGASVYRFELIPNKAGFLGCTKGALRAQAEPEQLFSTGVPWEAETPP